MSIENRYKKDIVLFFLSIIFFLFSALSFIFFPFSSFGGNNENRKIAYLIGIAFWFFTGLGYLLQIIIMIHRKAYYRSHKLKPKSHLPSIFRGFSNKLAGTVDITLILSFVIFLLLSIYNLKSNFVFVPLIILLILSFQLHIILNSENYRYFIMTFKEREE